MIRRLNCKKENIVDTSTHGYITIDIRFANMHEKE